MPADLLTRKQTDFLLWRPGASNFLPSLYIGPQPSLASTNPPTYSFDQFREIPLTQDSQFPELWRVAARDCGLTEGTVYFYWFKVRDTDPYTQTSQVLYCTDPTAWTIDRRFLAPSPSDPNGALSLDPASVVLYREGQLIPCDPDGQTADWQGDGAPLNLAPNNRLVIYELPTRWTRILSTGDIELGNGTFRDVRSLLVADQPAPSFPDVLALSGRAHLTELGVNALELLPPTDSDDVLNWGYGTANYFAADFDLGRPNNQAAPTASTDLVTLIKTCHQQGIRFFYDAVMAFARNQPYRNINYLDFYVQVGTGDPEQGNRDGFGGDLFKFNYRLEGYNPMTGDRESLVPAREFLKLTITHWLEYYRIDGIRIDSVNNIANYDFLQEFKELSRSLWQNRVEPEQTAGEVRVTTPIGGVQARVTAVAETLPDRFLVVGEELSVPLALIQQNRLDGLWNETFKQIVRQVILGRNWAAEPSFEQSVRKLIDCRLLGFGDGAQAVNYLTSHDVGGFGNERIYNWLNNNGIVFTESRIKLAFVCLLTAVGIPLIFAGDEFADQQDLNISQLPQGDVNKQVDPVNYSRLNEAWRQRIFDYVARLVRFRKTSNALSVNETQFIHVDFQQGKRVLAWRRGVGDQSVIVVANFSEYGTPNPTSPTAEYVVPNWSPTPTGRRWREVTQDRTVPPQWVGREPIYPWEAKVYALE